MDIETFIASRRQMWNHLERLLEQAERSPAWEFGPDRIRELVVLYRQTCSDLNQVRSMTANPEILDRLNQLTGQAYRYIYRGTRRPSMRGAIKDFVLRHVPKTFQHYRMELLLSASALILGVVFGFCAVLVDRNNAMELTPAMFFDGSPRQRVERIEQNPERIANVDQALLFGATLYVNNIRVAMLAFIAGAITLVGGLMLMFYNGVILGAVAASYFVDGVHVFFLAWVGPHGSLEIPAIVFGGGAGVILGKAFWMPGNKSVEDSLRQVLPAIWRIMLATMVILVTAGLIEGSFSQFSAKTISYDFKIFVGFTIFLLLHLYLFVPRTNLTEAHRD